MCPMTFCEETQFCLELPDDLTTSDVLFSDVPLIKVLGAKLFQCTVETIVFQFVFPFFFKKTKNSLL